MAEHNVRIQNATEEQWRKCVDMAYRCEGWGMSYSALQALSHAFGEENFRMLVAVDNETEEVIGFADTSIYPASDNFEALAHLGGYFVDPAYRGRGIGTRLFETAIAPAIEADINIGLLSAPAMSAKYAEKFGFNKLDANYANKRCHLLVDQITIDNLNNCTSDERIIDLPEVDEAALARFDAQIMPKIKRDATAISFFKDPSTIIKIVVDNSNEILGLCQINEVFGKRLRLRAWYARNEFAAELALKAVLEAVENLKSYRTIEFSPPSANSAVWPILKRLNGGETPKEQDSAPFQFTKHIPAINFSLIYSMMRMNFV